MKKAALLALLLIGFPVSLSAQGYPDVRALSRRGGYQAYRPKSVQKRPIVLPSEKEMELAQAQEKPSSECGGQAQAAIVQKSGGQGQSSGQNSEGEVKTDEIAKYIQQNPHVLSDVGR